MKINKSITQSLPRHNAKNLTLFKILAQTFCCAAIFIFAAMTASAATRIVFSRIADFDNPASGGIWTMNVDGTNRVQITNVNGHSQPAFSPDGRKIAFADSNGLSVANADGSGITQIYNNPSNVINPTFSPDGAKILFTAGNGFNQLYIINSDGSNLHQVSSGDLSVYGGAWSPDGTKIAYGGLTSANNWQIMLISADGSNKVNLTNSSGSSEQAPSFSPDGNSIVFIGNNQRVYTRSANVVGGPANVLTTTNGNLPNFSPDGTKIVYTKGGGGIVTMNTDGTNPTTISASNSDQYGRYYTPLVVRGTLYDFTGDGKADLTAFRPSNGDWWGYDLAGTTEASRRKYLGNWGASGDEPISADYDGDGKTDLAVYRPSSGGYFIHRSSDSGNTILSAKNGITAGNTRPVPADYDGDGKAEVAIYYEQTGTWRIINLANSSIIEKDWGFSTDYLPAQGISPSTFFSRTQAK